MRVTGKITKLLLGISLGTLLVSGCSKDRIDDSNKNEYKSTNEYLDSKKQKEQTFEITKDGYLPIIGEQKTKIWPDKSRLQFFNGDSVGYPYFVKLIELYTPKDMIYAQMPSVGGGDILTTKGEIRLRAIKDDKELFLREEHTWQVLMSSIDTLTQMKQYYGFNSLYNSYTDWTSNLIFEFFRTDSGYLGQVKQFGWIGCDKNASNSSSVKIGFTSKTDNLSNVATFIYIPSKKSVMQVYNQVSGKIPAGIDIKIVSIAVNAKDSLFYDYKTMTLGQNDEVVEITLKSTTDAALTAVLDAL